MALSDAACDLFERKGMAATLQEIAAKAGVSRRTVFRYVDHKEDLAFLHPRIWLDVLAEAEAELAEGSVRERLVHGATRISEHIDRDPAPVRRAMRVAGSVPGLAKGNVVVQQLWIERLSQGILSGQSEVDPFKAHILAAAVMGVVNAAMVEWYRRGESSRLVDFIEEGLDFIAPILDGG